VELKLEFVTGQDKAGEDIIEVRTFITNKIKTRIAKRAMEIGQEINKEDFTPERMNKIADFMCEVYGNKFTRDQLYDGLELNQLVPALKEIISGVKKCKLDTLPPQAKRSWGSWRS
jgi:hypothetical protein